MVNFALSNKTNQSKWGNLPSSGSGPFGNLSQDIVAACAEFLGTTLFLFIGQGGVQTSAISTNANKHAGAAISTIPTVGQLMYISASMGFSLLFSAWIFFRITGAAFNPNVSFALLLIGAITPVRFVLFVGAQLVGSIVASALLQALLPGPLTVTPSLGQDTSLVQGLFIEAFATGALILTVLFLAVEKHRATYLAPIGVGITLFACHMFAVVYTGAAMNSARVFGPSVVSGFKDDHWVYWAGPTLGALLAVGIYAFMRVFQYWKWCEGQDSSDSDSSSGLSAGAGADSGSSMVKGEEGDPSVLRTYRSFENSNKV